MASCHEATVRSEAQELLVIAPVHNTQSEAFDAYEGHRKNIPSSLSTCSGSVTSGTHASTDDDADSVSALDKAQASLESKASAWLDCGRMEDGMLLKSSHDRCLSTPLAACPAEEWNKASACAWLDGSACGTDAVGSNRAVCVSVEQTCQAPAPHPTEGAAASTWLDNTKSSNTEAWLGSKVSSQREAPASTGQRRGIRNAKLAPTAKQPTSTAAVIIEGDEGNYAQTHDLAANESIDTEASSNHGHAEAASEQFDGGRPATQIGTEATERKRGDPYFVSQPKQEPKAAKPMAARWSKPRDLPLPAAPRALPPPPPGAPPRPPSQTSQEDRRDQSFDVLAASQGQWQAFPGSHLAQQTQSHLAEQQATSWQQEVQHGDRQSHSQAVLKQLLNGESDQRAQGQSRSRLRSGASVFKPALSPTAPAFVPKASGASAFGLPDTVGGTPEPSTELKQEEAESAIRRIIKQAFGDRLMFTTFTSSDDETLVETSVRRVPNQSPSPYEQADALQTLQDAAQVGLGQRLHSSSSSDDGNGLRLDYFDCARLTWTNEDICWEYLNDGWCPRGHDCHWLHATIRVFNLRVTVQHGSMVQRKLLQQQQMQMQQQNHPSRSAPPPTLNLRPLLTVLPPLDIEPTSPSIEDAGCNAQVNDTQADTPRSEGNLNHGVEAGQESHVSTPRWEDMCQGNQVAVHTDCPISHSGASSESGDAHGLHRMDLARGGDPCDSSAAGAKHPNAVKKASWADLEDDEGAEHQQWS